MKLIGFYDYTVVLTYLSLISSVFGITQAIHGDSRAAIFCLALSGACDAFDGLVARTKKNRTQDEKNFGIQLDSLCDVVCFGVFPALICYTQGVRGGLGLPILFFYCLCAVIRLAFFNVLEAKRQKNEGGGNKVYRGLPVTSIAFIMPIFFLLQIFMSDAAFLVVLYVLPALVGFLFILDFPLKKPSLKQLLIMIATVGVTVAVIFACTRERRPDRQGEVDEIVDGVVEEIYATENP